ncbi:hypothetical protein VitviT2T_005619 [Vitis vinifera]|uniref:LRAT domain-containing protein n=1 Tax=Vitis vinifera TaxID=29760 RepID=A0ABY9BTC3_VITVI|nr:hypothetical protein VitviT2T_005619 [Vitis vinifera]
MVVVSGVVDQQRNKIVDVVVTVIARFLGAALFVPILQVNVMFLQDYSPIPCRLPDLLTTFYILYSCGANEFIVSPVFVGLLGNGDAKGDLRLANDSVKFHRLHNVRRGLQEDSVVFMNKSTMLKHFFKLHVKARRRRPLEMPYKLKDKHVDKEEVTMPCPTCTPPEGGHGVVSSCLNCLLAGDILYRFECSINPTLFLAKARGGTCTLAVSDPNEIVIHRVTYLLNNGFGCYNVFKNNCEDFAIYWGPLAAVLSTPLRLVTTNIYGKTATAVGVYCASRFAADIGMRKDIANVKLENSEGWSREL